MANNKKFIKQLDQQTDKYAPETREVVVGTVMKTVIQCSQMKPQQLNELSNRIAFATINATTDSIEEMFYLLKQEFNLD